jgi:hypothetical protein
MLVLYALGIRITQLLDIQADNRNWTILVHMIQSRIVGALGVAAYTVDVRIAATVRIAVAFS